MLAVGRALMLRPRLMLLDEPSFGLAPLIVEELFAILRRVNRETGVAMLIVEQNAALALDLADHAYLLETGRIVMDAARPREIARRRERSAAPISGIETATDGTAAAAGPGGARDRGIYACMALAVVMIYQAIDHLNFAQGEMAMFSTFIAWQLIQWGLPYWVAFVVAVVMSFVGGVLIERVLFRPIHNAPVLSQRRRVHRAVQHPQQPRRLHLGLRRSRHFPTPVRQQAAVRRAA